MVVKVDRGLLLAGLDLGARDVGEHLVAEEGKGKRVNCGGDKS